MGRKATPHELEWLAAEFNLEHFLKKLTLEPIVHTEGAPPMPALKARSTMTPLTMKPGGYRKLEEVKRIESLQTEVIFFFNNLNAQLGDGAQFKALALASQIPTEKMTETLTYNPYEVNDRHEVIWAMERGPLMTVQTLVHTIDEELRAQGWKFHIPRRNGTLNNQDVEPIFFTRLDESLGMESVKCIVVPLAPWEFTSQDFEDFTCMAKFVDGNKSMNGEQNSPPWRNADKMWAYLHDQCVIHDCRHFVLTTYEQWSFGGFSPFLTTSFVSEVKSWDAKPNSVLEIFTYWMLAACSFHNTIMIHEVPRERHIDCDLFEKERQLCRKRLLDDGAACTGPDLAIQKVRPSKRARKDHVEERVGWQPLPEHISTGFLPPPKGQADVSGAANRRNPRDRQRFALAKPSARWNKWWLKKRARDGKENSSALQCQEARVQEQPTVRSAQEFRRPILCYSMDIDREKDCFRPELIALRSFPEPPL